ncbi:IS3 family transposase (plasmid) [Klebsiella pneumoniae]|nr:IS3 family transposase [Klebsiella pneumoniae]
MNPFKGRHFQRDIILWAVRWYCKYGISYRELQEMLADYIEMFYNSKRRHGSSDQMSPTEYENQYYQRLGSV